MKRTYGVAAVTAIFGILMAASTQGCGSSVATDSAAASLEKSGPLASGADNGMKKVKDGGGGGSTSSSSGSIGWEGGVPACVVNVPLTPADLDQDPGWKAAGPAVAACTFTEIAQLESNLSYAKAWADAGTGLSQTCKACVVTNESDAQWGPIVLDPASGGMGGFFNFGACFGHLEGAACGRAVQYEQFCLAMACGTCATSAERDQCREVASAAGGMCKSFSDDVFGACPNIARSGKFCNSQIDAAKTLCGGAVTDAGPADGG
jgi:hypothetical protein